LRHDPQGSRLWHPNRVVPWRGSRLIPQHC
jgi:hypothetical protein